MKGSTLLITLLTLILPQPGGYGQAGGTPVHVSGPTSTTPYPPLRKFLPSTNPYAQRLVTQQFAMVNDIQKVDPKVLALFNAKVPAREIANRGRRFNPTDVE